MSRRARRLVASLSATGLLVVAGASSAAADGSEQGGLVDVSVGDVVVLNAATLNAAAKRAAKVCGVDVLDVAVVANQINRNGGVLICEVQGQEVRIKQA
jgi:hypothetical protein